MKAKQHFIKQGYIMKTIIKKHTPQNHVFISSLYQASLTLTGRSGYDNEQLKSNGVCHLNDVIELPFEEDQPLIHSIFLCTLKGETEQTQLIFTY